MSRSPQTEVAKKLDWNAVSGSHTSPEGEATTFSNQKDGIQVLSSIVDLSLVVKQQLEAFCLQNKLDFAGTKVSSPRAFDSVQLSVSSLHANLESIVTVRTTAYTTMRDIDQCSRFSTPFAAGIPGIRASSIQDNLPDDYFGASVNQISRSPSTTSHSTLRPSQAYNRTLGLDKDILLKAEFCHPEPSRPNRPKSLALDIPAPPAVILGPSKFIQRSACQSYPVRHVGLQCDLKLPPRSKLPFYSEPGPAYPTVPSTPVRCYFEPVRRNKIWFANKDTGEQVGHTEIEVDPERYEFSPIVIKLGKEEKTKGFMWRCVFPLNEKGRRKEAKEEKRRTLGLEALRGEKKRSMKQEQIGDREVPKGKEFEKRDVQRILRNLLCMDAD